MKVVRDCFNFSWSMRRCHQTGVSFLPRKYFFNSFWSDNKEKSFYLMPKCFLFNVFSRTQLDVKLARERVNASGLYSEIWTVKVTNKNATLHHGPVQPYNKTMNIVFQKHTTVESTNKQIAFVRRHSNCHTPTTGVRRAPPDLPWDLLSWIL